MKFVPSIPLVFVTLLAICPLASCAAVGVKATMGRSLDESKISGIKPNVTSLAEVLAWFGPPDYVIDGTRRMIDEEAFFATQTSQGFEGRPPTKGDPIPTRVLKAPDGMVILIYSNPEEKGWTGAAYSITGQTEPVLEESVTSARSNELFIFLSKKNRTVVTVAGGKSARVGER